jgi:hypothetical protein
MDLDLEVMEMFNTLRKKLDLVEAYWYFVEHGRDGTDCGLAKKTLAKFRRTALPEALELIAKLHKKDWGL